MNHKRVCAGIAALAIVVITSFYLGYGFSIKQANKKINASENNNIHDETQKRNSVSSDLSITINPYAASSPIHHEFDEFRKWVLDNKKLATLSDSTSPGHLLRLSGQLEAQGIARLPTELLEQRFSSVNKILASLDTHTCSMLVKGSFDLPEFMSQATPVMELFSDAEAKAWIAVNKAAIEAQLEGSPIIVLPIEDATRSVLKIAKSMYEPDSKVFISELTKLKTANDEDACAMARTLYSRGNSLPEPYRGYMARMLLTGKEGNEKI
ncbi:hypothetical protein [Paraburkholderia sp. DHOC27]|uniref:hypothetical protein n=1 Tax=Paraburkholderia sp. DHOC27 TaxID=2303330 RepID=UPI000E3DF1F3|nr:hypothetical protein [Paraburkholderia sp. DHOC27]RFU44923.1 hypothetical protein D0B32_24530 [Paraburkholderia sp. DHOC27]